MLRKGGNRNGADKTIHLQVVISKKISQIVLTPVGFQRSNIFGCEQHSPLGGLRRTNTRLKKNRIYRYWYIVSIETGSKLKC